MCPFDKNYYYFWNSNISVINLIEGFRKMTELSKNITL